MLRYLTPSAINVKNHFIFRIWIPSIQMKILLYFSEVSFFEVPGLVQPLLHSYVFIYINAFRFIISSLDLKNYFKIVGNYNPS